MDNVAILVKRLNKIGIEIVPGGNFPWIYIDEINGKRVTETYYANHGFTMALLSMDGTGTKLTSIKEIFKLLRKYVCG